jgi:hypothetical protein
MGEIKSKQVYAGKLVCYCISLENDRKSTERLSFSTQLQRKNLLWWGLNPSQPSVLMSTVLSTKLTSFDKHFFVNQNQFLNFFNRTLRGEDADLSLQIQMLNI